MPERRGATVLDDLPEEIIIDQILIRLLPKDIGRYRVIRRPWHTATSTPKFMLDHHLCQPSLPIIDGDGKPATVVVFRDAHAGSKTSSEDIWPFFLRPCQKFRCDVRLHVGCDGFLIVSQGGQFYICNPIIRQHALLPQPQSGQGIFNTIIGLYLHHPTGEYRVLWVSGHLSEDKYYVHFSEAKAYVLTVGSGKPRCISAEQPTVSSPSVEHTFVLNDRMYGFNRNPPIHHRASLHWSLCRVEDMTVGSGNIVVFDTTYESFRWMRGPQVGFWDRLFDMKGTLAFGSWSVPNLTAMDVWVMHDYETELWSFKYQIDMSVIEASRALGLTSLKEKKRKKQQIDTTVRFFSEIMVLNESELLIGFNGKHVLRCNIDGKFLQMVSISKRQYCMELTRHRLQESIMPIPSSHTQEENVESPFSTKHV